VSENAEGMAPKPGTLEHALWWARRMGQDVERARTRWYEIERSCVAKYGEAMAMGTEDMEGEEYVDVLGMAEERNADGSTRITGKYGTPPGWDADGSLLFRREVGFGPDPHERVTRLRFPGDGRVIIRTFVEGMYGIGESRAEDFELPPEAARRVLESLEPWRGQPLPADVEDDLLERVYAHAPVELEHLKRRSRRE
jgi:hypothetical protein